MLVLILVGIVVYWIPTIVAVVRRVPNLGLVIIINLLFGWSIVGWLIALVVAARRRPSGR